MNKVFITGKLGADPEVQQTQGGVTVARMSIADEYRYKPKSSDQTKIITNWHRVTAFGSLAEKIVAKWCKKGMKVLVVGRIQYGDYQDKEGIKRYTTDIIADEVDAFWGKKDSTETGSESQKSSTRQESSSQEDSGDYEQDLPF